jgi:hypothetical protein
LASAVFPKMKQEIDCDERLNVEIRMGGRLRVVPCAIAWMRKLEDAISVFVEPEPLTRWMPDKTLEGSFYNF